MFTRNRWSCLNKKGEGGKQMIWLALAAFFVFKFIYRSNQVFGEVNWPLFLAVLPLIGLTVWWRYG